MTRQWRRCGAILALVVSVAACAAASSDARGGYLATIERYITLTSSVAANGDLNPSAVVVAPATIGKLQAGDVLVNNSNNISNLQGTGTTIVSYRPSTKETSLFAQLPRKLAGCPGGVGFSGSMAVLKSGWVIVGSAPSMDGTTATKGAGCLLVLDAEGRLATTWAGPMIDCPWGNIEVIEQGERATLFVAMAGFDVPALSVRDPRTGYPVTVRKGTVLRLEIALRDGAPPELVEQTVIGDGFSERADLDNFLFGPTGLALRPDGALLVSDGLDNRITVIEHAATRTDSAGTGTLLTEGGLLAWPLNMAMTSEGTLLVCNGRNGLVVELDPMTGRQIYARWIDIDQTQAPPGNGNLFGLTMKPDGRGFYFVADDTNALVEATR
ncbi:MAG TPA: hypothetical protein VMB81_12175 [Candidatus Sulfotelmatobacter sp.]|nr:hypothetical protein [Candidatus Sulfotelmatobacter sp.]